MLNKKKDENNRATNSSLTETEGCQVWNVYLDTYDQFGDLISHVFLFSYEVGNCGGNPDEDQMPEGGGGGDTPAVNPVVNNLTDPCKNAALSAITLNTINNAITSFYNTNILPNNGPITLILKEGPVPNNGPAITQEFSPGSNIWETTLSNNSPTYLPIFMSQEAWGAIIAHEILHIMIALAGTTINDNYAHHTTIFNNFINTTSNLLQTSFGMTAADATKLALNGLDDLWIWGNFEQRSISLYGYSRSEFQSTYQHYTTLGSGTRCN